MPGHTYFVSGGCGFLGQHVVKALHDHDPAADLRVLDLKSRPTLLGIEALPRVSMFFGDLRKPASFIGAMENVETIIHCAGIISFKRGKDPACDANITSMQTLLQAALAHRCRNFIFISSISAVGRRSGRLSDETMYPSNTEKKLADPYGYSKLVCEQALVAEKDAIRGIILNPSVILGPGSPVIQRVLAWLRWIPCCPMLTNLNSFVDVRDVAKAVVLALAKGTSGERYIVTAENIDNLRFMSKVLALMDKRAPVLPVPETACAAYDFLAQLLETVGLAKGLKRSADVVADKAYCTEKIRRELSWQPTFTLEQTIRHMLMKSEGEDESKWQDRLTHGRV